MSKSKTKHVLLVEDEVVIALAGCRVLESAGYNVTVVHSGEQALETVSHSIPPDLILMAIDLGAGMTGPQAAQAILRAHDIPVVFLSSHTEDVYWDLAQKITSYGFIQNGSADTDLLASIHMAFRLWDAHRVVVEAEERRADLFQQVPGAIYQYQSFPDGTNRLPTAARDHDLVADMPEYSHYLEAELYDLVQRDPTIFAFLREGSLDGMWYWDIEKPDHEWMDNRFWELFGHDPQTKRHDPAEWQDLIHPEDLKHALENFQKHLEDPDHPYDQIVRYTHQNGTTVYVRCRGMAIRDENGTPRRMLGVHNDVTELMNTINVEKRLRHELNHRVKNNLAIVHSLISLKHSEDNTTADLSDILHQVETIRVLHEQLQATDELTTLELTPYLRRVLASVFDSSVEVEVEVSGLEVEVTSKVAVPLGLVVNELATNAAKHGFSRNQEKRFTVNIRDLGDGSDRMHVTISNSGIPFPSHVDVDNPSSLGLRLVSALVSQLESSLTLTKQPHPVFEFDVEYEGVLVP